MKTVSVSDTIFATVITRGNTILRISLVGMSSIEEIISNVSSRVRGLASGFVTLLLRNSSQGWASRQSLRLSRNAFLPEGTQLSLFCE